jgi:small subunit ribosomal protein S17
MTANIKETRVGQVVSDRMEKTVVVAVKVSRRHRIYGKALRRTRKYKAHDGPSEAKLGDTVRIAPSRPISREKRWAVVEILSRKGEAAAVRMVEEPELVAVTEAPVAEEVAEEVAVEAETEEATEAEVPVDEKVAEEAEAEAAMEAEAPVAEEVAEEVAVEAETEEVTEAGAPVAIVVGEEVAVEAEAEAATEAEAPVAEEVAEEVAVEAEADVEGPPTDDKEASA